MSLIGLNFPEVDYAFDKASTEHKGITWLVLSYLNRDAVHLAADGVGTLELQKNLLCHGLAFAIVRMKRKTMIVTYESEDSTLVQKVRANVHLRAIKEKFDPQASATCQCVTDLDEDFFLRLLATTAPALSDIAEEENRQSYTLSEMLGTGSKNVSTLSVTQVIVPAQSLSTQLSPEKARLMKALEKRRQNVSKSFAGSPPERPPPTAPLPELPVHSPRRPTIREASVSYTPIHPPTGPSRKGSVCSVSSVASIRSDTSSPPTRRKMSAGQLFALETAGKPLLSGWINVQLSTSPLWRRRWVRIDSRKQMVLDSRDGHTRTYDIPRDVRTLRELALDEQELSHSVTLEMNDGTTLCCACADANELEELRQVILFCLSTPH